MENNFEDHGGEEQHREGQAWVEMNDKYIIDTSIFPTLYCDKVLDYLRVLTVLTFSPDETTLIIDKQNNHTPLRYKEVSVMSEKVRQEQLDWLSEEPEYFSRPGHLFPAESL